MLASKANIDKLEYPLYVSTKLDGVRAYIQDSKVYARSGKLIPNPTIQKLLGLSKLNGIDGELIYGSATDPFVFRNTVSHVMTYDEIDTKDIYFYAFDNFFEPNDPFDDRYSDLCALYDSLDDNLKSIIHIVDQEFIQSKDELLATENLYLSQGYEGVMLRKPHGYYKFGRSTVKEGYLLKLKRFNDSEAKIIAIEPLYHNENEATINELGHISRSSNKENLIPMDTMGHLVVEDIKTGVQFSIGSGFDEALRKEIWKDKDVYMDTIITYTYFSVGEYEKPRFPIFKGFRNKEDL